MMPFVPLAGKRGGLDILCLGAHSDDIEIGCGATILSILASSPRHRVHWVVLSASPQRAKEARRSAALFLKKAEDRTVIVHDFRDGFFPYQGAEIKEAFEDLKRMVQPDLIFTHYHADRHQDHRLVSDLTWNTFRNHLVLEYEIPKYDADLGRPNAYYPVDEATCRRKMKYLHTAFASQRDKHWFDEETFRGLMRIRGLESVAARGYAEAFHSRKLVLAI